MNVKPALLTRSAALASIAVATMLVALKGWAALRTQSVSMYGSLADSGLDLVASLTTLVGVWIAALPADDDHRFGHGKAEALAAFIQVALIAVSATGIIYSSIENLVFGAPVVAANEGIVVSIAAIVLTFALLGWQRFVIARTGSLAISTDNVHYQSDLLLNLSVIAALVLESQAGFTRADPIFGIGIALWLAWGAWRAGSDAIDHLMDREWAPEKRDTLIAVVARQPELSRLHDLRTRTSGDIDIAQFHIEIDPDMSVRDAHDVLERVEHDLHATFPRLELFVHIDPRGQIDEPGNALVESNEFERLEERL